MTWTNDRIILLIELYREKQCLRNLQVESHKWQNTVYDAWTKIEMKTDITVDKSKRKVKKIQSWSKRNDKMVCL